MACPRPVQVANGFIVGSQSSYPVGSSVKFSCKPAYSMTGSSSMTCASVSPAPGGTAVPVWIGDYPTCTLEFLESAWFWLLVGIVGLLTLGFLSCLIYMCVRFCCGNCRTQRGRKIRDAESGDNNKDDGCCQTDCCGWFTACVCCCKPNVGKDASCCDFFGCCGYGGCCACCCGCVRCCREGSPTGIVTGQSWRKSRPRFVAKKGSSSKGRKSRKGSSSSRKLRGILRQAGVLPTTRTVHALMANETTTFRKKAVVLPVWKPFYNPVRNINTSTQ